MESGLDLDLINPFLRDRSSIKSAYFLNFGTPRFTDKKLQQRATCLITIYVTFYILEHATH